MAMDSLKFQPVLPCPTGGPPPGITAVSGVACHQGGRPAVVVTPLDTVHLCPTDGNNNNGAACDSNFELQDEITHYLKKFRQDEAKLELTLPKTYRYV
jgi:hypothetical protein